MASLENVVRLFCESGNLSSLTDARWSMHTKQQDCDNLPPTKAALKFKVSWSHLVCLIWKSSRLQFPKYCDPTTLGWEKSGDVLIPILTNEPPAPEVVTEISLCKCKTGCSTMRCTCKKNSLTCTEMCLCTGCENVTIDENLEHPFKQMTMVKALECKIKWATEQDKQVRTRQTG